MVDTISIICRSPWSIKVVTFWYTKISVSLILQKYMVLFGETGLHNLDIYYWFKIKETGLPNLDIYYWFIIKETGLHNPDIYYWFYITETGPLNQYWQNICIYKMYIRKDTSAQGKVFGCCQRLLGLYKENIMTKHFQANLATNTHRHQISLQKEWVSWCLTLHHHLNGLFIGEIGQFNLCFFSKHDYNLTMERQTFSCAVTHCLCWPPAIEGLTWCYHPPPC